LGILVIPHSPDSFYLGKLLHIFYCFILKTTENQRGSIFAEYKSKEPWKMEQPVQTAMIIDDDVDLSGLLTNILESRKIYTMAVHSLPEAEAYLTYLKPTVIFLDNSFPEGLGVNFIRHIKSADNEIKIIMMTAEAGDWIEKKAYEEGVNCFLKKPLSTAIINGVLDEMNFRH
jgi:CheY-like chemotaxis protein